MASRAYRFAAAILPFVIAIYPVGAQTPSWLEAGAGAGGSVFGWQPRIGATAADAFSLGTTVLSWHGSADRTTAGTRSLLELTSGARLSTGTAAFGFWLGGGVIHRSGFNDDVERPRIETGGWRRIGNVVLTISAARRSASLAAMSHFTHTATGYAVYQDSITGGWDSIPQTRTFGDSSRVAEQRRWGETAAALAWEGRALSVELGLGGRLASRGVPAGGWGSANVAVRLSAPLSLVIGAGTASHGQFALDGEHRFITLGLRIRQTSAGGPIGESLPLLHAASVSNFAIDSLGSGRYCLTIGAPRASRVELSGDFTNWKPVTLTRRDNGQWTLTLALRPGTHRLNARVDGGSWIVPPGLTTMSDDFAGEVGLLVIERGVEIAPK
jgi:hypothetical protein